MYCQNGIKVYLIIQHLVYLSINKVRPNFFMRTDVSRHIQIGCRLKIFLFYNFLKLKPKKRNLNTLQIESEIRLPYFSSKMGDANSLFFSHSFKNHPYLSQFEYWIHVFYLKQNLDVLSYLLLFDYSVFLYLYYHHQKTKQL